MLERRKRRRMSYNVQWKEEPEDVWIACTEVKQTDIVFNSPKDVIVYFVLNGTEQVAFVPEAFVDMEHKLLAGRLVGESDGNLLVDIPVQTITAGFRHLVKPDERSGVQKRTTNLSLKSAP
jgi:hypothetical protein